MLRIAQPKQARKSRTFRGAALVVAGIVASSGVAADTLAQPPSNALEQQAAHYIQYRQDVAEIEATPLNNAKATRDAHKRLAAHDPTGLSGGWVAYAALVAADTPEFAADLKKELKRRHGRLRGKPGFLAKLAEDPSYPRKLKGAKAATARVLEMTMQDISRFYALGENFKRQAYAMQKTNWGKKRIASSDRRLQEADQFASSRPKSSAPELERTTERGVTAPVLASASAAWSADWGADGGEGRLSEPNAQVIMDRVLNLAARYAVGSVNDKVVEVYSKNNKSRQCLELSKLTLSQCIAATRTPYEEAFCLGEHGLNDIGGCIGWVAGQGAS
ncbi:MAG: hypothetical protein AAF850_06875 [Pseudomonadota bacterium]